MAIQNHLSEETSSKDIPIFPEHIVFNPSSIKQLRTEIPEENLQSQVHPDTPSLEEATGKTVQSEKSPKNDDDINYEGPQSSFSEHSHDYLDPEPVNGEPNENQDFIEEEMQFSKFISILKIILGHYKVIENCILTSSFFSEDKNFCLYERLGLDCRFANKPSSYRGSA